MSKLTGLKILEDGSELNASVRSVFGSGAGADLLRMWEKQYTHIFNADAMVMAQRAAVHDFIANIRRLIEAEASK